MWSPFMTVSCDHSQDAVYKGGGLFDKTINLEGGDNCIRTHPHIPTHTNVQTTVIKF